MSRTGIKEENDMFTMMMDVKAVDNVREMLIANNTQVRKVSSGGL